MNHIRGSLAVLVALLAPSVGLAVLVPVGPGDLTGSRSTPDASGIVAFGEGIGTGIGWSHPNGGFKILWDISRVGPNWDYLYTISNAADGALSKGMSHWILEVSDTITQADLGDHIWDLSHSIDSDDPRTYDPGDPGNSNPDLPAAIYGMKFNGGGQAGPLTFTFTSDRQPVWGDFYANDGTDKWPKTGPGSTQYNVTAWNVGLDPANGFVLNLNTTDFTPWIPTPDTENGGPPQENVIPEPGTMVLVGFGLLGLIGKRRRRPS